MPHPTVRRAAPWVMWAAVAVGAMAGASLRYGMSRWLAADVDEIPWATLVANVAGSFVLGVVTALASAPRLGSRGSALVGTGLCGALTTFSTFAVEVVQLGRHDEAALVVVYVVSSAGAGICAARLGLRVPREVAR